MPSSWAQLETLQLMRNGLSSLPAHMSRLTALQLLKFQQVEPAGLGPLDWIQHMPGLTHLELRSVSAILSEPHRKWDKVSCRQLQAAKELLKQRGQTRVLY